MPGVPSLLWEQQLQEPGLAIPVPKAPPPESGLAIPFQGCPASCGSVGLQWPTRRWTSLFHVLRRMLLLLKATGTSNVRIPPKVLTHWTHQGIILQLQTGLECHPLPTTAVASCRVVIIKPLRVSGMTCIWTRSVLPTGAEKRARAIMEHIPSL